MPITQNEADHLQRMYSAEIPPLQERRIRLMSLADNAAHGALLLYAREHMPLVKGIRLKAVELRPLCMRLGEPTEDRAAIVTCAQELQTLMAELARVYPVMGSAYYQSKVTEPVATLLRELDTPLPSPAKAGK